MPIKTQHETIEHSGGDAPDAHDVMPSTSNSGQAARAQEARAGRGEISTESFMHWAQSSVNAVRGGEPIDVDGKNGPKTRAAVKAIQARAPSLGEPEIGVDGVVGPVTTGVLERATHTKNPEGRPIAEPGAGKTDDSARATAPATKPATKDDATTEDKGAGKDKAVDQGSTWIGQIAAAVNGDGELPTELRTLIETLQNQSPAQADANTLAMVRGYIEDLLASPLASMAIGMIGVSLQSLAAWRDAASKQVNSDEAAADKPSKPAPKPDDEQTAVDAPDTADKDLPGPATLSRKALQSYFDSCMEARMGDRGMAGSMINAKVSGFELAPDARGTSFDSAEAAWQHIAEQLEDTSADSRTFSLKLSIADGDKFASFTFKLSRQLLTKKDDATISKSLVKADSSHTTGGNKKVADETYTAYQGLYAAAQASGLTAEFPDFCKIASAYRSVATQEKLFSNKVNALMNTEGLNRKDAEKKARKWVARPGGSAHHTGHALDLKVWKGSLSSGNAGAMKDPSSSLHKKYAKFWHWLQENAPKYGFLPYDAEPWHWEKIT